LLGHKTIIQSQLVIILLICFMLFTETCWCWYAVFCL